MAWFLKNAGNPGKTLCIPGSWQANFKPPENNAPVSNFPTNLGGKPCLVRCCRFHSCRAEHASYNVYLRTSKLQSSRSCGKSRPTYLFYFVRSPWWQTTSWQKCWHNESHYKWCMYQVVPCCAKKFQQSSLAFGHEGPKGRGAHMCSLTSMFGWLNEWRNDWLNHKLNSWIGHWRMHEWMIKGSRTSVRLLLPGKLLLLAISSLIILAKSSLKPAPSPRNFALGQLSSELFLLWANFSLPSLSYFSSEPLHLHATIIPHDTILLWAASCPGYFFPSYFFSELPLLWATSSLS